MFTDYFQFNYANLHSMFTSNNDSVTSILKEKGVEELNACIFLILTEISNKISSC